MPGVTTKVVAKIADHQGIMITIPDALEIRILPHRHVWHYRDADWQAMEKDLRDFDWHILDSGSVDDAIDIFYDKLYATRVAHVPQSHLPWQKSSLPWLNDRCSAAIDAKHTAEGTAGYLAECENCHKILQEARTKYRNSVKQKLANLPHGSKRWWRLNKQLLNRQVTPSFAPPIKNGEGAWCKTPVEKANAYACCWAGKNKLPRESYEHAFFYVPPALVQVPCLRTRVTRRLLDKLRNDQATGPDDIGAIMLKKLAGVIALPLTLICRRIFSDGAWPTKWKLHHIIPIYKKGSVYLPSQYRGIHLTCILSKTVERMIGQTLIPFLERLGFGDAQWAFRKKSSARDLVTISLAIWCLSICQGNKIGVYLSDISGAFDKVRRALVIGKLSQLGLPSTWLDFLNAYLSEREGFVTVEGAISEAMLLSNMVFQGTVLGPCLWNGFFADVAVEVPSSGQSVRLFADDLAAYIARSCQISNATVLEELRDIQEKTHVWGERNQVTFDPGKESFQILHPSCHEGSDFKYLGTWIDCALSMAPCVEHILTKSRPKIRSLLRVKDMYSLKSMLNQFKAHLWSVIEYHNGALIMATQTQTRRLDSMQRGFLHELGICDEEAFVKYNFAPLSLRRRIGILGFIHKCVLQECHPALPHLLPMQMQVGAMPTYLHTMQVDPHLSGVRSRNALYSRSLYHFVLIYNRLPQDLVNLGSVSAFQSQLTKFAKLRAERGEDTWRNAYEDCGEVMRFFHS